MAFRKDIKKVIQSTGKYKVQSVSIHPQLRETFNGKYKIMKIEVWIKNEKKA